MNGFQRRIWYCIDSILAWRSIRNDQKTVKSKLKRNRMLKKRFPRVNSW